MKRITLQAAQDVAARLDKATRDLNAVIIEAASLGLIVEATIIVFEQIGSAGPTPLLEVAGKVRPGQVVNEPGILP